MKYEVIAMVLAAFSLGLPQAANADPLPKGAVKLTSAEAKAIYSGKTASWTDTLAYFAPNGRYLMIGKDKSWFGEGKWTVRGNKVCASIKWTNVKSGKTGAGDRDCWTWYKAGDRYLDLWSGDKNGVKNGWFDGERKKLSDGDHVSATLNSLKAKVKSPQ